MILWSWISCSFFLRPLFCLLHPRRGRSCRRACCPLNFRLFNFKSLLVSRPVSRILRPLVVSVLVWFVRGLRTLCLPPGLKVQMALLLHSPRQITRLNPFNPICSRRSLTCSACFWSVCLLPLFRVPPRSGGCKHLGNYASTS